MSETRTEQSEFRKNLVRTFLPGWMGLLILPATGCVLQTEKFADPAAIVGDLPPTWTGSGAIVPRNAVVAWVDDFGDSSLRSLIEEAITDNYALAAASARVRQAQEQVRLAGADRLPVIDSGIRTTRSQNLRGASFQSVRANNFSFSLDLSWEADLWGRLRDLRDAEIDRLAVETNLYESSRLSLAANVAKTAFEIIESREQIKLTGRTLTSLRTNLEILDSKLEAGDAADGT
ncbi:MAG: TolC family protein, partial [Verrucomicrobiota bacterium]